LTILIILIKIVKTLKSFKEITEVFALLCACGEMHSSTGRNHLFLINPLENDNE